MYAEYFLKGVDRRLCGHTWYTMHYTTAKVILVFHVQYIMKMLKGTKREILSAMHVKELIQSNHSER